MLRLVVLLIAAGPAAGALAQHSIYLEECARRPESRCLLDIAWSLAADEKNDFQLNDIATSFAKAKEWERAEAIYRRIPEDSRWKKRESLDAEYVARALSEGSDKKLRATSDPAVLFWAASRVFGYRERRGPRLAKGFGNSKALGAPPALGELLLVQWEALAPPGRAFHYERLAEKWLIAGNVDRAKSILFRTQWKNEKVLRNGVELLLDVEEPGHALSIIEAGDTKRRGFYRTFVAQWELRRGNNAAAAETALRAVQEVIAAREFRDLAEAAATIGAAGRTDEARNALRAAEAAARQPDPFRPFHLSDVGEAYGRAGDPQACLRLQHEAVGFKPKDNEVVGTGAISGSVTYGGLWNLGGQLANKAAAASTLCGERDALTNLDNRVFSQWYCDLRRHKKVHVSDVRVDKRRGREAYSLLLDRAAECHLELGEQEIGEGLLRELVTISESSKDFGMLRRAAELAHVFLGPQRRNAIMQKAAKALLEGSSKQQYRAREAADFAYLWTVFGPGN